MAKIKLLIILITLILIILFLSRISCEKKMLRDYAAPVKVMRVEQRDMDVTLDYVGNIKGQDEVLVYPKVGGKILEKVKEENSAITKGEVMLYIDRDEVGYQFEKAPVESPITGIVGRIFVDIGTNVTPETPVALVVNTDTVKIALDIPQKYLPKVFLNQEAKITVDAYPDVEFTGLVTKISPVVDITTRSSPIEIRLDNQDYKLRSGMFAKVRLVIETHQDVPVVLKEALMGRDPDYYVFIVDGKKAILKNVKVGARYEAYFEVTEGLKENDLVVIMGQQKLRDGAAVEYEE